MTGPGSIAPGGTGSDTASPAVAATAVPLVSVLITAHDRPEELRTTLRALRRQTYPALELLVFDDASDADLGAVVREEWPGARFWRNVRNAGAHANRSAGMREARGEYIVTLDDDSAPVDPTAIARAVRRFEAEPELGLLAFHVHEGVSPPADDLATGPERYVHAFINCAQMLRTAAARSVGGYRDFFVHYYEEPEYALRVLDRGWRILYYPSVVVHHRMSAIGRSDAKIVAYSFRNALWTVLLDLPFPRAAVEFGWKFAVGGAELLRQGDVRWAAWAVGSLVRGLPRVARERTPVSAHTLRVYDALRLRDVRFPADLDAPAPPRWRERWAWLNGAFRRRRRARAVWDPRPGALGEGAWTTRPPGA